MNRREWCAALGKLCSPMFPAEAAKALTDMLPALRDRPDALFCQASLIVVASVKYRQAVPNFAELQAALEGWRRTYLPDPHLARLAPPPAPARPEPTEAERAYVAALVSRHSEELAQHRPDEPEPGPARPRYPDVTVKGEALRRLREARELRGVVDGDER